MDRQHVAKHVALRAVAITPGRREDLTAMSLTLAAVGAVVTALLQSTVLPYLQFGGARPDVVLIYAIVVTIVIGIDHGIAAAFVGGLTIDVLASRPFGSTAFVLLLAVGAAALIGRALVRGRAASVIVAAVVLGFIVPFVDLAVYGALRAPIPVADPLAMIVPDVLYSTAIAALFGFAASILHRRYFEQERIDW